MTHTEYMRIWRNNNRERYREITNKAVNKWRRSHPQLLKIRALEQNNRHRFGGMRFLVIERDKYKCVMCFTHSNLTVDHIDRNRKNNSLDNLQTLCQSCHGRKDGQARKITCGWTFIRSKSKRKK